jgi:hypothetical protein
MATEKEIDEERDEEEEEVKRIVRGWGWGGGGWDWVRGRKGGWFFPGFVGRFSTLFFWWWWFLLVLKGFAFLREGGVFM